MVSAAVRLATFNIPQYARMTMVDEMDFGSLGEKKKAIFCVIPVDDSSMNYLVGMLYTQCFQALYRRADEKHNGRLPVPVRVIQDEWANVAQPESYPKILATCRSYNIGLNIIVQNIQQIKALYEKEWESIIGNCDTLLFLGGGNEPTSLEFIVKLLGKETIDGKQYLKMKPIHADFALLGTYKCDEYGNCWYKGTMRNFNVVMATAADTVIAECEYIVPVGDIEPENIHTYGMCVDYIVEGDRK